MAELYDLENDPGENRNLAEVYPEKVLELKKMLERLQTETAAQFPIRNPEYKDKKSDSIN